MTHSDVKLGNFVLSNKNIAITIDNDTICDLYRGTFSGIFYVMAYNSYK